MKKEKNRKGKQRKGEKACAMLLRGIEECTDLEIMAKKRT